MLLTIENLSFGYSQTPILHNASLVLNAGEVVAILGSNGAGKSTLLKLVLGLVQPQANNNTVLQVNGVDVLKDAVAARQHMAYLPEQTALYPYLTGLENLRYFLALSTKQTPDDDMLFQYLRNVGLQESAWHQRAQGYSKGMKQKVMLAIAHARQVKLLLLDEPNSGLDPVSIAELHQSLLQAKAQGVAVLMVTHDIIALDLVADRALMLREGKLEPLETQAVYSGSAQLRALYRGNI